MCTVLSTLWYVYVHTYVHMFLLYAFNYLWICCGIHFPVF